MVGGGGGRVLVNLNFLICQGSRRQVLFASEHCCKQTPAIRLGHSSCSTDLLLSGYPRIALFVDLRCVHERGLGWSACAPPCVCVSWDPCERCMELQTNL